ncbi:MAG: Asp-tRNA(Asn)/Glu-tRNA(Gln) amidotransferase GatCAB subunit A [Acidobacteria bacterium]|nr:MAG: Asp-tRNA(Asn)/Glu-tRNA(Gln) amidotransferase GatCAB subunit A [Acidobacteriota bacterium]
MVADLNLDVLTVGSARAAVQERQTTATALVENLYEKIDAQDRQPGQINAYLNLTRDRALKQAKRMDAIVDRGDPLPPLGGVPIAIKDVMVMQGVRTTAGGSSNENSAWGPVRNPRDLSRVPGGSSGGSAASVAAGTAVAALGSDTGGSIRQPGAFCGVVGLMPTYGRVSRYGLIAFASSLDHIGPLTKSAKDAGIILRHMAGRDPMDSTCVDLPVPDYEQEIRKPVRGLRVGVPKEYFPNEMDSEVRSAVESGLKLLTEAGCEIKPISLPHTQYAIPTYYVIATAEASSNLARYDGVRYGYRSPQAKTLSEMYRRSRDEGFGPEVKRRIMLGTYALSAGYYDAYYLKAQKVRTLIAQDFFAAFKEVDGIVTPTTPTPAFKIGEKSDDPLAMYLADIFTVTASLAGIPGISVPCGNSKDGLPIGMQILGRHFEEGTILRLAHAFEHARASATR